MSGKYDEKLCCCALNGIFGFEPKISKTLIDSLGSASAVFGLDGEGLDEIFGPYSKHKDKITERALEEAEKEIAKAERTGAFFLGYTQEEFPSLLRECEDPPAGLYVKSAVSPSELFNSSDLIAVVGTRDISLYGKEWTERVVTAIAQVGDKPVIVSGLAKGVDICAHRTALKNGLPTIAVMATGIDSVYPWTHIPDSEKIVETGALVTDFPTGTTPVKLNFIRRNRIIAGMSRAVILAESKLKGGGMMTANLAFSYGRDLYALPGRADDDRSQGCNWLIREKKAEPVFSEADLVKSLGLGDLKKRIELTPEAVIRGKFSGRTTEDRIGLLAALLSEIRKNRGITVEDLSDRTGIPWKTVRECVGMLECDGLVSVDLMQRCSVNFNV